MKKLILLIFLCAVSVMCWAQNTKKQIIPKNKQPFQISIRTDKHTYEVGEMMLLTITVVNESNNPISVYKPGNFAWLQGSMIIIEGPNGIYSYKGVYKTVDFSERHFVRLKPKK